MFPRSTTGIRLSQVSWRKSQIAPTEVERRPEMALVAQSFASFAKFCGFCLCTTLAFFTLPFVLVTGQLARCQAGQRKV